LADAGEVHVVLARRWIPSFPGSNTSTFHIGRVCIDGSPPLPPSSAVGVRLRCARGFPPHP
jgi:hypothetical protein